MLNPQEVGGVTAELSLVGSLNVLMKTANLFPVLLHHDTHLQSR